MKYRYRRVLSKEQSKRFLLLQSNINSGSNCVNDLDSLWLIVNNSWLIMIIIDYEQIALYTINSWKNSVNSFLYGKIIKILIDLFSILGKWSRLYDFCLKIIMYERWMMTGICSWRYEWWRTHDDREITIYADKLMIVCQDATKTW